MPNSDNTHLIDGEFQSDKYPTTPRGKVPLSVKDKSAQDLLWLYAQRRRAVDAQFADDLEAALRLAGYQPKPVPDHTRLVAEARKQMESYVRQWPSGLVNPLADAIDSHQAQIDALESGKWAAANGAPKLPQLRDHPYRRSDGQTS